MAEAERIAKDLEAYTKVIFLEEEKKEYAASLLNCAESKNLYASAFGGAKMRTRIDRILSYKKLSFFSTVCFLLLSVFIAYALLTNAVS